MRCEVWEAKGTNCGGGDECTEDERAAGSYIVNSFSTIHSVSPGLRCLPLARGSKTNNPLSARSTGTWAKPSTTV